MDFNILSTYIHFFTSNHLQQRQPLAEHVEHTKINFFFNYLTTFSYNLNLTCATALGTNRIIKLQANEVAGNNYSIPNNDDIEIDRNDSTLIIS